MKLVSPIPKRRSRIVIIPLIDIMFFLLASFMMVSLQMSRTANQPVHLPPATQAHPDYQPDRISIAVDRNGTAWLEKQVVTLDALTLVVSNRWHSNTNLPVYISGDRDTLQGRMVEVYEAIRRGGVQNVSFMTGPAPQPPPTHETAP